MEGAESLFLRPRYIAGQITRVSQPIAARPSFVFGSLRRLDNASGEDRVHRTRLASNARPSVTSSANSKSPPTGRPLARRVTLMSKGLIRRAR